MKLIPQTRNVLLHSKSVIALVLLTFFTPNLPDLWWTLTDRDLSGVAWWCIQIAIGLWGIWGRIEWQGISDGLERRRWPATILRYAVAVAVAIAALTYASRVHAMTDWPPAKPPIAVEQTATGEVYPALPLIQVPTEDQAVHYCAPFVAAWEGLRLDAYLPTPNDRWTIGYGATFYADGTPVKRGDRITKAQAVELLEDHLRQYRRGMHRHWTAETIRTRLPITRDCAVSQSFPLNVGIAGAGGSTAAKRINAGWVDGGCKALAMWNKQRDGAGVLRPLPGLTNRRADETRLCMVGL